MGNAVVFLDAIHYHVRSEGQVLGHHPQWPEEPGCGGHLHCLYG